MGGSQQAIGKLMKLARLSTDTEYPSSQYVCRSCGSGFDVQYHVCPECGGYSVDPREDFL